MWKDLMHISLHMLPMSYVCKKNNFLKQSERVLLVNLVFKCPDWNSKLDELLKEDICAAHISFFLSIAPDIKMVLTLFFFKN